MKDTMLHNVAEILGNGYKCYANTESGEVYAVDEITVEQREHPSIKEYVPLEGPVFYELMKKYCAQVEDFEKQSELMEAMLYEQPFQNFKRKVYALHIADDWIAYRTKAIVEMLSK